MTKSKKESRAHVSVSVDGDDLAALSSGYGSAASATGRRGFAVVTGDSGAAVATGKDGTAMANGDGGVASATASGGMASASGLWGVAVATSLRGAASVSGKNSLAGTTNLNGSASATGKHSAAVAVGVGATVVGGVGGIIVAAEWVTENGKPQFVGWCVGIVGQDGIEPNVAYRAMGGRLGGCLVRCFSPATAGQKGKK